MSELRFDVRCNNKLFTAAIQILTAMTGVKWGFMRRRRRVQYVSSLEIPLRIGTLVGKHYDKTTKYDYNIVNKPGGLFHKWVEHLTCELRVYMITAVVDASILKSILAYHITAHTATLYDDAAEYNTKYANISMCVADAWLSGTEFIIDDEIVAIEEQKIEQPLGDW